MKDIVVANTAARSRSNVNFGGHRLDFFGKFKWWTLGYGLFSPGMSASSPSSPSTVRGAISFREGVGEWLLQWR